MMYKLLILNLLLLSNFEYGFCIEPQTRNVPNIALTQKIDALNTDAFGSRLTDPKRTINKATEAFYLAKQINYLNGKAEACRVIGVGQYYLSKYEKALDKYLEAISYFEQNNNLKGAGKVYNNIGNLYLLNDYNKAFEYYNKSLVIAKKFDSKPEIAGLLINIGIIQMKKKNFTDALDKFQISMKIFQQIDAPVLVVQCMQNIGEAYNNLKQYHQAEKVLKEAFAKAQAQNLNYTVAGIDLTLTNVYLNLNQFDKAEETLKSGFKYAKVMQNHDLENDYTYAFFQLEYKKKNYFEALNYLKKNYTQDSAYYRQSFSKRITLASDLFTQLENRRKNERTIAQQKYATTLFGASTIVAGLLLALAFLLFINVKRTKKSNKELTRLNAEVSLQKENLDRINHHLEDIIDERTRDLKVKNKTLSDYSLHLSHQVRGPIATLKGIVYLQENDLINQAECIKLIKTCVFNIDDQIISMSKMLNEDPDTNAAKI